MPKSKDFTLQLDRRAALSALASAPALAIPKAARAGLPAGRIVSAIARHRGAAGALAEACRLADDVAATQEGRAISADDMAAFEAADEAEAVAMADVLASPITTPADLRALVEWAAELQEAGRLDVGARVVSALRASPLLAV